MTKERKTRLTDYDLNNSLALRFETTGAGDTFIGGKVSTSIDSYETFIVEAESMEKALRLSEVCIRIIRGKR